MGGSGKIRVILKRSVAIDFSQSQFLISGDKNVSLSQYEEDTFHMGNLAPAVRKERESQSALLASAVFLVPLTPNNQYAKVAYVGMAYPEFLQYYWSIREPIKCFVSQVVSLSSTATLRKILVPINYKLDL